MSELTKLLTEKKIDLSDVKPSTIIDLIIWWNFEGHKHLVCPKLKLKKDQIRGVEIPSITLERFFFSIADVFLNKSANPEKLSAAYVRHYNNMSDDVRDIVSGALNGELEFDEESLVVYAGDRKVKVLGKAVVIYTPTKSETVEAETEETKTETVEETKTEEVAEKPKRGRRKKTTKEG